jgi:glycosyltransferase involved in cell wall biosynthesis
LEALPRVAESVPNVTLTVVGSGTDLSRLRQLATRLDIDNRVEFSGNLGDHQLVDAYLSSDVFALPSAQEGFGLASLEAMAAGKPVVAASAGASAEMVIDGKTGFLVTFGNVSELAQILVRVLTDAGLRHAMGQAAREHVLTNFGFHKFSATLEQLILKELVVL